MHQIPSSLLFFSSIRLLAASTERLFSLLSDSFVSTDPPGKPLCIHAMILGMRALLNDGPSFARSEFVFSNRLVVEDPSFVDSLFVWDRYRPGHIR